MARGRYKSNYYGSGRRSSRGSYKNNYGQQAARNHVYEARKFSEEIGGYDDDVKEFFFGLPQEQLNDLLMEYATLPGSSAKAAQYARETLPDWKRGTRRMSGLVAKRLFSLLPKRMPLNMKYELAGNIWRHFGPSSSHAYVIGVNTPVEDVVAKVLTVLDEVVTTYNVPSNISARFDWLADGDIAIKEQLLNYFRQQEKYLAVEKVRLEIPVLQKQLRDHPNVTSLVRSVLQVHKHQIAVRVRKGSETAIEVDRNPGGSRTNADWFWGLWWLWGLLAWGAYVLLSR